MIKILSGENLNQLQNANYKVFGKNQHSSVKLCLWTKRSIKTGEKDFCYKQRFYGNMCGIKSHRCLQMTCALTKCNLRCSHCWRQHKYFGTEKQKWDSPEEIYSGSIKAQRELLTGLGGVQHSEKHLKEAMNPNQVAMSLDGELFFYPHLDELIGLYKKNNFSVFLVTNGTFPEKIKNLKNLPTNFYMSLTANSEKMFVKTQHPLEPNLWEKIQQSLKNFSQIPTTRVIRITAIKNFNMNKPEKYAELISPSEADFIEIKSWMAVGGSRNFLKYQQMPSHDETKQFALKIADVLGYKLTNEKQNSRVVLLEK